MLRIYLGIQNKDDVNAFNILWQALHMIAWKFVIQKHTKAAIEGIPPTKIKQGIY